MLTQRAEATPMAQYRRLNLMLLGEVTIGLICIPTAGKLVDVLNTPLSVTIFYFPLVYVLSDVITEVYGYAIARRLLWYTIAAQLIATLVFQLAIAAPPSAVLRDNQSYIDVLSGAPRLVLFGTLAIFSGDTVNNLVVAKMKVWCRGRFLPVRFVLSTFCGQLIDTTIFYVFALGTLPPVGARQEHRPGNGDQRRRRDPVSAGVAGRRREAQARRRCRCVRHRHGLQPAQILKATSGRAGILAGMGS